MGGIGDDDNVVEAIRFGYGGEPIDLLLGID